MQGVCTIFMMVFGMTRPWGELTTYRARGGHATDWANPTRFCRYEFLTDLVIMWRCDANRVKGGETVAGYNEIKHFVMNLHTRIW